MCVRTTVIHSLGASCPYFGDSLSLVIHNHTVAGYGKRLCHSVESVQFFL